MNDIQWLANAAIAAGGLITGALGGVAVRERQLMTIIKEGEEKLNARIDRVQQDFVRRDDLNGHITRLERSVQSVQDNQLETHRRIDALLAALSERMK